ncbi:MAG: cysteine peptidase family C39 domain-containing protein, partial [Blastocatellia bacterium]
MITWYAQEQDTSCVAACVRIVLSSFGQQLTEKRIRKILGNPLFGLSLPQTYQRLTQAGLKVAFHDDWALRDLRDCLRDGSYPIVGLERRFFGNRDSTHAVVLIGLSSQAVGAFDPLGSAQAETFNLQTFELAWNSAGHQALVV